MSDPVLLVDKKDGYAVLTLNRPNAMNALNQELRNTIASTVIELEADPDVRVLVITGAGERAFTAGLDLKELGAGSAGISGAVADDPVRAIRKFSGPIICAVNGVAITGGFEVALAGDIVIASENARFADTHARVGIMPGWGLSQKLSRMIGISRAKELSFTGNFLSAEQAERWGLVNRVLPADELLPHCEQLAKDMLTVIPEMLVAYKSLIDEGYDASFGDGMALEAKYGAEHTTVDPAEIEARREAVRARGQSQKG